MKNIETYEQLKVFNFKLPCLKQSQRQQNFHDFILLGLFRPSCWRESPIPLFVCYLNYHSFDTKREMFVKTGSDIKVFEICLLNFDPLSSYGSHCRLKKITSGSGNQPQQNDFVQINGSIVAVGYSTHPNDCLASAIQQYDRTIPPNDEIFNHVFQFGLVKQHSNHFALKNSKYLTAVQNLGHILLIFGANLLITSSIFKISWTTISKY